MKLYRFCMDKNFLRIVFLICLFVGSNVLAMNGCMKGFWRFFSVKQGVHVSKKIENGKSFYYAVTCFDGEEYSCKEFENGKKEFQSVFYSFGRTVNKIESSIMPQEKKKDLERALKKIQNKKFKK
ncbi:hypothetical protein KAH94_06300 [bacterium]|nr:hypothetical protein [bacterium]